MRARTSHGIGDKQRSSLIKTSTIGRIFIMNNFEYFNPTRIVFGKGQISRLRDLVPQSASVLMCYGGGSIKHNGVYEQVLTALAGWELIEFSGIEPNPDFDTLMHAIRLGREKGINFVLEVGGGSVIDGAKLIAAGIPYQ
jgi:NADP-dependent alcohol dehydrogenase